MYKVLIVDDEYLMRKALSIVVEEIEAFEIVGEAETGLEALQLAQELSPDLIFMDILIPGMNGLEVSRIIKKQMPDTIIVILTAHNDFQYAQKGIQIGVEEYLLKPCSFDEIRKILFTYKENHVVKGSHSFDLINNLSEKDYKKICEKIHLVILQIFKKSKNQDAIFRQLNTILSDALDMIPCLDKEYQEFYKNKYQIREAICNDIELAEFWLYDLVDEVFKQKSIQNYPQLIKVFTFLEDNIKKEVSLQSAADYSDLSLSYLSRLFKKEFGINFTSYIKMKKVTKSKKLLKKTDLAVAEVAYELGYNESSYFCKVFKAIEGITPTQYREKQNNTTE